MSLVPQACGVGALNSLTAIGGRLVRYEEPAAAAWP